MTSNSGTPRVGVAPLISQCCLLLLLGACGSDPGTAGRDSNDAVVLDTGTVSDIDPADSSEADIEVPRADGSGSPGDVGNDINRDTGIDGVEFCTEDDECASQLCYLPSSSPDLGVCTALCTADENCPESWRCVQDQSAGGDAVRICVPTDLCIDADEDGRGYGPGCIATDCNESDPTIYVGAPELCDGADNDCDNEVDEDPVDENDDCTTGFAGVCAAGRARCVDGLFACEANTAASDEICDGLDNDCDGATDEDAAGDTLERGCYTGPEGTAGVGVCVEGTSTCIEGRYAECGGAVLPGAETCDGLDNNCDGQADEGAPGSGAVCSTGLGGLCDISTTVCEDGELRCLPTSGGRIEVCDGVDNDCDGDVDEENPGGGGVCGSGLPGVCAAGVRVCEAGSLVCNPTVAPAEEVCDGLDNDCDGAVDEGNPDGGADCTSSGVGACQPGRLTCSAGALTCVSIVSPSPEICDGLDNNCNGTADEGNPGGGLNCPTGALGLCGTGVTACEAGAPVCNTTVGPTIELCNGLDDNCDGTIDDSNPGGGRACGTGNAGVCAAGITVCDAGGIQCQQTAVSSSDTCDGLDNDCDGSIDEGNPGGGGACATGRPGICSAGTAACSGGGIICNQNQSAATEVCDTLDNDCDGRTNEQCPSGFQNVLASNSPAWANNSGGSAFTSACPGGTYAAGFYGSSGSLIDRLGTRCASMTMSTNTGSNPWSYSMNRGSISSATSYGGNGGAAFTRDCPSGSFLIGFSGRAADKMDAMQGICARFDMAGSPGSYVVRRTTTSGTASAGGGGGSPYSWTCPDNGVVQYIYGRSGSIIDAASVRCTTLAPTLVP